KAGMTSPSATPGSALLLSLFDNNLDVETRTTTAETNSCLNVLPVRKKTSAQAADTGPQIAANELPSNFFVDENLSRLMLFGVALTAEGNKGIVRVVPG